MVAIQPSAGNPSDVVLSNHCKTSNLLDILYGLVQPKHATLIFTIHNVSDWISTLLQSFLFATYIQPAILKSNVRQRRGYTHTKVLHIAGWPTQGAKPGAETKMAARHCTPWQRVFRVFCEGVGREIGGCGEWWWPAKTEALAHTSCPGGDLFDVCEGVVREIPGCGDARWPMKEKYIYPH